jgi:hypothetical protein
MNNISFTGTKQYNDLINDLNGLLPARMIRNVKIGMYDGLTQDEFKLSLPTFQKAEEKEIKEAKELGLEIVGSGIRNAKNLLKKIYNFQD